MKKSTWKVFMLLVVIMGAFILWQVLYKDGGLIAGAYNAIANVVNRTWSSLTGQNDQLMVPWNNGSNEINAETDGTLDDGSNNATN